MTSNYRNPSARRTVKKINEQTPAVRQTMYGLKEDLKRYRPGDRFLSVKEVQAAYAVSDSVAKVALSLLVEALLIDPRPGRGYFVIDQSGRKETP